MSVIARIPEFDANVRWLRDQGYDFVESRDLACPACGHMTVDHSWVHDPAECLINLCPCPGLEYLSEVGHEVGVFEHYIKVGGKMFGPQDTPELDEAFTIAWNS